MDTIGLTTKAGLAIQAYPEQLPTRERAIEAIANEMHDAVEEGNLELVALFLEEALHELAAFTKEEHERSPESASAKIAMLYGMVFDAAGRSVSALSYDLRSLELARTDQDRAKALHNCGCSYLKLGHFDKAMSSFERCLQLEPAAGWTIAGWFKAMVAVGRSEEAFDELLTPSRTAPMSNQAWAVFDAHLQKDAWLRQVQRDSRWKLIRPTK